MLQIMIRLICKKNLLPELFVSRQLQATDFLFQSNISRDCFKLAVPVGSLDTYPSWCNVSPERLVVTAKVSVKKVENSWALYEYIPTPLAWGNFRGWIFFCTIAGRLSQFQDSSWSTVNRHCLGCGFLPRQCAGFLDCVMAMLQKKSKEEI